METLINENKEILRSIYAKTQELRQLQRKLNENKVKINNVCKHEWERDAYASLGDCTMVCRHCEIDKRSWYAMKK